MTTCRVRLGRDSPATGSFDWSVLDPGGTSIAAGTAPAQRPPAGLSCELVLASDLVLLDTIPAPAARQRRISSALRFLVEDGVIPDPEKLHVATGPLTDNGLLAVAIVDRSWMEQALAMLAEAGLIARSACPECLLPELPPRGWTVVLDGRNGFARTGEMSGFTLDSGDDGEAPVALRLALDQVRASPAAPDRLVARPVPGIAPPPAAQWAAKLGIPVEIGPDWRWPAAHKRPVLDLLQGEFAPRVTERNWTRMLRRSAILVAALAVVSVCGTALEWAMNARERSALAGQMKDTYRRSFGESAVVVDAPLQMARALEQLRRQSGEPAAGDFVPLFAAVADRLLDPARHRVESIGYTDGVLTLSVRPVEAARFSALFNEMRAKASIPGIEVSLEPAESSGKFSLRAVAGAGRGR
jgi:general secretion pathway protein L